MEIPTVRLGTLEVSRLILGGNPFSGFSHQSAERSAAMRAWYTDERIVETLFQAEALGLRTCLCRGDEHITRVLARYRREGGAMRWIAQTDSQAPSTVAGARYCLEHGADACYLHGGQVDHFVAQERYGEIERFVEVVRAAGLPAGIAGHMPADFVWAEAHLDLDFYMVSYYNPSPRQDTPHHDPTAAEQYLPEDREARVALLRTLHRPAIHYKVLAAGRTPPEEALAYTARHMRAGDAVCVGVFTADKADMLAEDLALLMRFLHAEE
ncbi:MAG: SRPBCC family protein [Anaerolineae bacterium]